VPEVRVRPDRLGLGRRRKGAREGWRKGGREGRRKAKRERGTEGLTDREDSHLLPFLPPSLPPSLPSSLPPSLPHPGIMKEATRLRSNREIEADLHGKEMEETSDDERERGRRRRRKGKEEGREEEDIVTVAERLAREEDNWKKVRGLQAIITLPPSLFHLSGLPCGPALPIYLQFLLLLLLSLPSFPHLLPSPCA